MLRLKILMEQNGESKYVGDIVGNDSTDACFSYSEYDNKIVGPAYNLWFVKICC